jgi:[ribosomal protein S18]-alanine N-acetyltransferase
MRLRAAEIADLEALLDVERAAADMLWPGWPEASLAAELSHADASVDVIEDNGAVVAHVCGRAIAGEWWILQVTTHPDWRRRGYAATLLAQQKDHARRAQCASMWLEVRATNAAALALYARLSFVISGRRPVVSRSPRGAVDDAVLMSMSVDDTIGFFA